jgi:HK97 family phage prohead protease
MTDDGHGSFSGYASIKNNIDLGGDLIVDGAYKNLDQLQEIGWGALSHDWYGLPIAMVMAAKEDQKGLYFESQFHSTDDAQDCRKVMQERLAAGKQVSLSIGYYVTDAAYETRDGNEVRILKSIDVFEISFVTLGMNPKARVTAVKGAGRPLTDHSEALLADAKDLATRYAALRDERKDRFPERYEKAASELVAMFGPFVKVVEPDPPAPEPDAEAKATDAQALQIARIAQTLGV